MSVYVPKLPAAVRLGQPHREPRDGAFLLFPEVGDSGRCETVFELLNSDRFVIPFVQQEDSRVRLLVRENVDWVAIGPGVDPALVLPPGRPAAQHQRVELHFVDDREISAVVRWGAPDVRLRLSDFLAAPDLFLAAEAAFGTLIANKRRMREIRIVD